MATPFTYTLPPELLAHAPAEPRDAARLLHFPGLTETAFKQLPDFLSPGDALVVNTSKVIPARLFGMRPARATGGASAVRVEILLHKALQPDLTCWEVFARPLRRLKRGDVLQLDGGATAEITALGERPLIRFNLPAASIPTYLEKYGHTPLPPYIQADDSAATRARYQTVYANAKQPGSVAAPTAGLHFTPAVLAALAAKGVKVLPVTLHVGAGTFLNPTAEQIATKQLHAERAEIPASTAQAILATQADGKRVVAVGTTALRSLESWARFGALSPNGWQGETTLFIQPGDAFAVADGLLTNFHLPDSSLLMLVGAFIGEENLAALYAHAIAQQFRFYSFGDTSLLWRAKRPT